MPTISTCLAPALLALAGTLGPAVADPGRPQCQAGDEIPEFVTRRVELVAAGRVADPRWPPAVELERDPVCRHGLRTEP